MGNVQVGSRNVAGEGDEVAVQVGRIGGHPAQEVTPDAPEQDAVTVNVRCGNATVGEQVDVVVGGLTIRR